MDFQRIAARLVLLAVISTPAPSLAAYSTPFTLSQGGQDASAPQVVFENDGDALIVWRRFDGSRLRVQARNRSAAGVFGPINTLSVAGDASPPQVAVDADGDALVVWESTYESGYRVYARPRSAAGAFGASVVIASSSAGEFNPQVGMNALGDALIVYTDVFNSGFLRIDARHRSANGVLREPLELSGCCDEPSAPQIAMNAAGNALIVWSQEGQIQARAISAAGVLGPLRTLSDAVSIADQPQVAMDASGNALVVWRRFDGSSYRIQARFRTAGGALRPLQTISPVGETHTPQVALDEDGDALILWSLGFGTERIMARTRSAAGVLGSPQSVSAGGGHGFDPQVAFSANGAAQVVWWRDGLIQARAATAAGVFGPIRTLSASLARFPQVAFDAAGDALVVWQRYDGLNVRIEAASGP